MKKHYFFVSVKVKFRITNKNSPLHVYTKKKHSRTYLLKQGKLIKDDIFYDSLLNELKLKIKDFYRTVHYIKEDEIKRITFISVSKLN